MVNTKSTNPVGCNLTFGEGQAHTTERISIEGHLANKDEAGYVAVVALAAARTKRYLC